MVFTSGDECDRCHKTFDYQVTLDNHKKNYQCYKEDKESTCTTCGNDFRNKFLLADHTRKYHTVKECEECGKEFTATHLKRHMLTHEKNEEGKTLNCNTCNTCNE